MMKLTIDQKRAQAFLSLAMSYARTTGLLEIVEKGAMDSSVAYEFAYAIGDHELAEAIHQPKDAVQPKGQPSVEFEKIGAELMIAPAQQVMQLTWLLDNGYMACQRDVALLDIITSGLGQRAKEFSGEYIVIDKHNDAEGFMLVGDDLSGLINEAYTLLTEED